MGIPISGFMPILKQNIINIIVQQRPCPSLSCGLPHRRQPGCLTLARRVIAVWVSPIFMRKYGCFCITPQKGIFQKSLSSTNDPKITQSMNPITLAYSTEIYWNMPFWGVMQKYPICVFSDADLNRVTFSDRNILLTRSR